MFLLSAILMLAVSSSLYGPIDAAPDITSTSAATSGSGETDVRSSAQLKRLSWELLKRARGLERLRLGKRSIPYIDDEMDNFPIKPPEEQFVDPRDYTFDFPLPYYISPYSFEESYEEVPHMRIRRSTPSEPPIVTPYPEVFGDNADEDISDELKDSEDDDHYLLYPVSYNDANDWSDDDANRMDKRQLPMFRLGKRQDLEGNKRNLNMLRLGKRKDENMNSAYTSGDEMGQPSALAAKRNLNMLRLGKRTSLQEIKRNLNMLRLGKRDPAEIKRNLNMLRLGKREDFEQKKRNLNMLRLGKRESLENEKRNLNMLRLGKRESLENEKRNLNMLRLGKRVSLEQEKRNLNMLRLGKRESMDNEKRNLNMLRLGKRNLNMLRLGKRNLNMLRLGKRNLNMLRLGKRNLNMLRLGKRNLNMLRLGKREDDSKDEDVKRNLNMLRLGKRSAQTNKRHLNMLRLGKRSVDESNESKTE